MTKIYLGEGWLYFLLHLQAIIEGSKNPEQELRQRPWKTELLTGLLACSLWLAWQLFLCNPDLPAPA